MGRLRQDAALRKHAPWMAQPDDRVLAFLRAYGPHRPEELRAELADLGGGLVYPHRYLDGTLDASTLDRGKSAAGREE